MIKSVSKILLSVCFVMGSVCFVMGSINIGDSNSQGCTVYFPGGGSYDVCDSGENDQGLQ